MNGRRKLEQNPKENENSCDPEVLATVWEVVTKSLESKGKIQSVVVKAQMRKVTAP